MLFFEELKRRNVLWVALAELARTYSQQEVTDQLSDEEAEPVIRETMARALAIDPDNALVQLYTGGVIRNWENDYVATAPHFARSFPKEPMLGNIHDDPRWNEFLARLGNSRQSNLIQNCRNYLILN